MGELNLGPQAKEIGRQIFTLLEIDVEMCSNVYGEAPCTAGGGVGTECFNCWETCVDKGNYSVIIKTLSFVPNQISLPIGLIAYPCIEGHPDITPSEMEQMRGLGARGALKVTMTDFEWHDRDLDPYWRTRQQPAEGTWWGRFRARYPYYKERPMRLYVGYAKEPFDKADLSQRLYFIENISGPTRSNKMTITGKDILKKLSEDRRSAPAVSYAWITEDLSPGETSINYETEPGYDLAAPTGWINIGEEVISYEGNDGSTLTGCDRGAWGTDEPEIHEEGDAIQQSLYYWGVNVIDVVYDLLVNYGDIDPVYIPYADWEAERDVWLLANDIYSILCNPQGIDETLSELTEQHAFNIWWDETAQQIKLKAVSPQTLNADPPVFNDLQHFLKDSVDIRDDDSNQITQLWLYYGVHDPTQSLTDPGNFTKLMVARDHEAESPNEFGIPKIRRLYCNWLAFNQGALARTIVDRILVKSSKNQKKIKFSLDAKDISIWQGDDIIIQSRKVQTPEGRFSQLNVTITKVTEKIPGTRYDFEGAAIPFVEGVRYAFIVYNDWPGYEDATDSQKRTGFFISDGDSDFPDGGSYYRIS